MNNWFPNESNVARDGGQGVRKSTCFSGLGDCYVFGSSTADNRFAKRARPTDYEADVLQREMESLSMKEVNSSEQAVLGNDEKVKIILNRGKHNDQTKMLVEDPAFVSLKCRELDAEIETMELLFDRFGFGRKNDGLSAYKLARDQNKAYIDNTDFKIGFLRADRYDPKRAARRMLSYLAEKHELFGTEKLTSDICMEDLGEDGRRYLHIGGFQVLTKRDKSGRMMVCFADSLKKEEVEAMRLAVRKGYFYMLNCLSEEDNQVGKIKGFVAICWRVHKLEPPDPHALNSIFRLFQCSPIKIAAFHLCRPVTTFELEYFNQYSKMILPVLKNNGILRFFRSHYGTAQEIKYTLLLKYLCPDCLPLRDEFNTNKDIVNPFHTRNHKIWLANRVKRDSAKKQRLSVPVDPNDDESLDGIDFDTSRSIGTLDCSQSGDDSGDIFFEGFGSPLPRDDENAPPHDDPQDTAETKTETKAEESGEGCNFGPKDVLLGQAPALRAHPGNVFFRQLVNDSFDKYYASEKKEKTVVAEEIVLQIKREGGRFLKKSTNDNGEVWIEANDGNEARYKVSHTFRSIVKKKKREAAKL